MGEQEQLQAKIPKYLCAANSFFEEETTRPAWYPLGHQWEPRYEIHGQNRALPLSDFQAIVTGADPMLNDDFREVGYTIGTGLRLKNESLIEAVRMYYDGPCQEGSTNWQIPLGVYLMLGDLVDPGLFLRALQGSLPNYLGDDHNVEHMLSKMKYTDKPIRLSRGVVFEGKVKNGFGRETPKSAEVDDVTGEVLNAYVGAGHLSDYELKSCMKIAQEKRVSILRVVLSRNQWIVNGGAAHFGSALFTPDGKARVSEEQLRAIFGWLKPAT